MKVVVIEGPDNTGKSTVIYELIKQYACTVYIHCSKPEETDPILAALNQTQRFRAIVDKIRATASAGYDIAILDRSWIGEYVYGCKYRGNGEEYVKRMISDISAELNSLERHSNGTIKTKYILLTADKPEFCVKNDDGQSLSDAKLDNITDEIERFNTIWNADIPDWSLCNKRCIIVNDGMKFRDKETIFKEVTDFVNSYE